MSLQHQIRKAEQGAGLALGLIQIDGGTQSRATLNEQVVTDYAEAIKAGATFPPVVVFYDGKKHWLADGFHRFHAFQQAGRDRIEVDIRQGTRRDAILHSVGANEAHGLRRTNDDKRRAVLTLLNDAEWVKWSDREIARRCAVHHELVGRLRPVTGVSASENRTYTTKHGTEATMQTAGINAERMNAPKALVNDEPSPEAGPQAEASLVGTDTGTPADREGRIDGEAASVDLPTNSDDVEAIRAGYITQYHVMQLRSAWSKANGEARSIFLAEIQSQAKASEDNGATVPGEVPADSVTGEVSRASVGADTDAPIQESERGNSHRPSLAARGADEVAAFNPHPQPTSSPEVDKAEPVANGSATPFSRKTAADYRPHCLHPDACGSSKLDHCYSCKKAAGLTEAAAP